MVHGKPTGEQSSENDAGKQKAGGGKSRIQSSGLDITEDESTVKQANSDEANNNNSSNTSVQESAKPVLKEKSLKSDVVNKKTNSSEVEHSSRRNSRRLTSKGMKNESAKQTKADEFSQIKGTVEQNSSNNCEGACQSESGDTCTTVLVKSINNSNKAINKVKVTEIIK